MLNSIEYSNLWDVMQVNDNKIYFSKEVITWVVDNIKDAFGYCCREGISLNEYCPNERFGNKKNEKTTFISVRLSELWENAVYHSIKNLFGHLEISTKNVSRWTTEEGDLKVFNEIWELKSSQAKDSWTGATHSTKKMPKYILINYHVNLDLKLDVLKNEKFIYEFAIFLLDASILPNDEKIFKGEPRHNSSFTTLKLKNEWKDSGIITEIWGSLEKKVKNLKIIPKTSPLI